RLSLLTADARTAYDAVDRAMTPTDEVKRPNGDQREGKALADQRLVRTFEQASARADAVKKPNAESRSERRSEAAGPQPEDAMPKGRNFH
ncbi:MAG: hypothetical protein EA356_17170, partial [Geminicoccaceae bacterium]